MAVSDVGDRKSFPCAEDESFDHQGYCLTVNADGEVVKATGDDAFIGTNFISSEGNTNDREIRAGEPVPVEQDGWVNVLCEEGHEYATGDAVYLSATDGVADPTSDTNTRVGTVMRPRDTVGETGARWVVVSITGYV